eukprot:SAG11_NODE_21934_length_415_cov_1.791139_1_plen_26_part_01
MGANWGANWRGGGVQSQGSLQNNNAI